MSLTKPLLPSPKGCEGWSNRPLTSGEASMWLRELLIAGGADPGHVVLISSHSLKATVLSWAAKKGIPIEVRRLLGHHLPPGDISAINYSRDALAGPMQFLVDLLSSIRLSDFRPDDKRSSRIAVRTVSGEGETDSCYFGQGGGICMA